MGDNPFVDYYEKKSISPELIEHFYRLRDLLLDAMPGLNDPSSLRVADIGCGAGTFSMIIADSGCSVQGIDINEDLVRIGNERALKAGVPVELHCGSATSLPWEDATFDIVAMPELLEHVPDWETCLTEASRVLRRGGILYISTTNRLCPSQQEFSLPLYSWYPGWLKQHCVKLATTTHRAWVNHASYPAVHWFDPYFLGSAFRSIGLTPIDRFGIWAELANDPRKKRIGKIMQRIPPLRLLGHIVIPDTILLGRKT